MAERRLIGSGRRIRAPGGVAGGGSPPPTSSPSVEVAEDDPLRPGWAALDAALGRLDPRLRLARPADGPGLSALVRELAATQWEEPRDPAPSLLRFLDRPRCGLPLIAVEQGAVVGLCLLQHMPLPLDDGDQLCLDDLYVRRAARGRGLGRLLLAGVDVLAVVLDVRYLYLHVQPEKQRARRLYAAAGLEAVDTLLMDKLYAPPASSARR
ncbi:MAG: hypothetical protein RL071_4119 [Pseudomonadota bacterium]